METSTPPTNEADLWIALRTGMLPAGDLLAFLPAEAGKRLWNRLHDASAPILRACETPARKTPACAQEQPPPLPPPPPLARVAWPTTPLTPHSQDALHRLVAQSACRLADALEVFIRCPDQEAAALALLREEIGRLAAVYQEFERRTWRGVAAQLFDWGLRWLRHRRSSAVALLLWGG